MSFIIKKGVKVNNLERYRYKRDLNMFCSPIQKAGLLGLMGIGVYLYFNPHLPTTMVKRYLTQEEQKNLKSPAFGIIKNVEIVDEKPDESQYKDLNVKIGIVLAGLTALMCLPIN